MPFVGLCSCAQELSLAGNCLQSLPPQLGQLSALKRLGLAGNRLTALPDSLGALQQLEGLWLHGNLLQALPDTLSGARQAQRTPARVSPCGGARAHAVPCATWHLGLAHLHAAGLASLTSLVVSGNRLEALPEGLGGCTSLQELAAAVSGTAP